MRKVDGMLAPCPLLRRLCWAVFALFSPAGFADYEQGVNAAFNGDFETAYREFSLAADAGLDLAQYNLGILYFTGQGVEKDAAAAFRWTEAAARQGHVAAQYNLGSLYYAGDGTEVDRDKAVEMFGRAAKAGHPNAALLLANMFAEGEHVNKDAVQAHAWASMAIQNENLEAVALREDIQNRMSPQQLSQARRLFARWQIE
ncbi:MAG: tetratricopeptide repeat protein [Pseudohongiellaceae bacterium]